MVPRQDDQGDIRGGERDERLGLLDIGGVIAVGQDDALWVGHRSGIILSGRRLNVKIAPALFFEGFLPKDTALLSSRAS